MLFQGPTAVAALSLLLAACAHQPPPSLYPASYDWRIDIDANPDQFQLLIWSHAGKVHGQLVILSRYPRATPDEAGLDSGAIKSRRAARDTVERTALQHAFGCTTWHPVWDYEGNLLSACAAPFLRGRPRWAALKRRWEEFLARVAARGIPYEAADGIACRAGPSWHAVIWTPGHRTQVFRNLPVRRQCGATDQQALQLNLEGRALIDSVIALARRGAPEP